MDSIIHHYYFAVPNSLQQTHNFGNLQYLFFMYLYGCLYLPYLDSAYLVTYYLVIILFNVCVIFLLEKNKCSIRYASHCNTAMLSSNNVQKVF